MTTERDPPETARAPCATLLSLVLCACGGSDGPDPRLLDSSAIPLAPPAGVPPADDATAFGLTGVLAILQNLPAGAGTAVTASFLGFPLPLQRDPPEPMPGDGCVPDEPIRVDPSVGAGLGITAAGNIGAGDALVLSSPAGTFATLPRTVRDGTIGYVAEVDTPVAAGQSATGEPLRGLPVGLVLDVPGERFPAVSAPVPHVEPIAALVPAPGAAVDGALDVTWTPSTSTETWIEITLTDERVSVTCTAVDDGAFTVPAFVASPFADDPTAWVGRGRVVEVSRHAERTLDVAGDARLIITNVSFAGIVVR